PRRVLGGPSAGGRVSGVRGVPTARLRLGVGPPRPSDGPPDDRRLGRGALSFGRRDGSVAGRGWRALPTAGRAVRRTLGRPRVGPPPSGAGATAATPGAVRTLRGAGDATGRRVGQALQ